MKTFEEYFKDSDFKEGDSDKKWIANMFAAASFAINDLAQQISNLQEVIRDIKRQTAHLPKVCGCGWNIPKDGICQNPDCKVCITNE